MQYTAVELLIKKLPLQMQQIIRRLCSCNQLMELNVYDEDRCTAGNSI